MDFITFEAKGRPVTDPVVIETKSGAKGVKGSIAINKLSRKVGNSFETKPIFMNYEFWDIDFEEALAKLGKGQTVRLTGDLKEDEWESPSGEKRKKIILKIKTAVRENHANP